jgi:hypothetical protein
MLNIPERGTYPMRLLLLLAIMPLVAQNTSTPGITMTPSTGTFTTTSTSFVFLAPGNDIQSFTWDPTTDKIVLPEGLTYEQALHSVLKQYSQTYMQYRQEAERSRNREYNNTRFELGKIHDAFNPITHQKAILKEDRAQSDQAALTIAVELWKRALGPTYIVNRPMLITGGDGACSATDESVACSYSDRIVVDHWTREDKVTVMLHEMGHVLGVPHIEGDALMNATLGDKPVKFPTPDAIALAKVHKGKR